MLIEMDGRRDDGTDEGIAVLGGPLSPLGWSLGFLAALGIAVDDAARYGAAALVRRQVAWPTRRQTIDQARNSWRLG